MSAPPPPTDDQLIRLARVGDFEAFTALYQRHLPAVVRRVRCCVPAADVDDVTQEVFVAVLRALPHFRGQSRFSTWLRTLVNRRIADYYRRRGRSAPTTEASLEDVERFAVQPDGRPSSEEHLTLVRAMAGLPESYREVLLLRFSEDLPFDEIARLQGRSLDATKSLFRRAVAALRARMENEDVRAV